jgi:hypothetical protein
MSLSPTQRTIKYLKDNGCIPGIVEKFNQYAGPYGIRQDLFGFLDIISIDPTHGIVGIQSCGQSFKAHIDKMTGERNEAMYEWLRHAKVQLIGWRKVKLKRGGKAMRWKPRIANFWLENEEIKWSEL